MSTRIADFRKIPAFCINLETRPDRWEQAKAEFARLGWAVARCRAIVRDTPMRGCLDSHRALWVHAEKNNLPVIAVFEDDCVFPADFIDIFAAAAAELPEDWQFWQLHSFHADTVPVGRYVTKLTSTGWGTHGYIVREAAYKKFLTLGYPQPDTLVTGGYIKAGGVPYGVVNEHALCFQRGDDSDIPATAQNNYWRKTLSLYGR